MRVCLGQKASRKGCSLSLEFLFSLETTLKSLFLVHLCRGQENAAIPKTPPFFFWLGKGEGFSLGHVTRPEIALQTEVLFRPPSQRSHPESPAHPCLLPVTSGLTSCTLTMASGPSLSSASSQVLQPPPWVTSSRPHNSR